MTIENEVKKHHQTHKTNNKLKSIVKHKKNKCCKCPIHCNGSHAPFILTLIISVMLLTVIIILTKVHVNSENKDIFSLITGNLIGAFLTSCGFWFVHKNGSTKNSLGK